MEVHLKKIHSDKFECGLCDLEAGSLENLEIHLNTCEVYQCTHCRQRFKTVMDIKKHFVEVNYLEYGYLAQLKLDRNECNKVTEKGYHSIKISFLQFHPIQHHLYKIPCITSNVLKGISRYKK